MYHNGLATEGNCVQPLEAELVSMRKTLVCRKSSSLVEEMCVCLMFGVGAVCALCCD